MRFLKLACVALCLAGLLSSIGCCYHAQHFGKRRDIGWGEIGCAACQCDQDCTSDCQSDGRGGSSHTISVPVNPVNLVNGVR